jgi:hypothetical protein
MHAPQIQQSVGIDSLADHCTENSASYRHVVAHARLAGGNVQSSGGGQMTWHKLPHLQYTTDLSRPSIDKHRFQKRSYAAVSAVRRAKDTLLAGLFPCINSPTKRSTMSPVDR